MRRIINILSALLCMCLLFPITAAFADDAEDAPHAAEWDELTAQLLADHGYSADSITLGYYNLATGEEHYLNPDTFMAAGSMYKVATSMYYCDKIDSGELEWDSVVNGYQIKRAMSMMIINSDNETAQLLWQYIGGWKAYRAATAPYFGIDPDNVDAKYFRENYLTPRHIISELRQVYENIDGKYKQIYEYMAEAEPEKYFKGREQKYEMGHKYGWIELDGHLCVNDSAIVFAADPIAIVMFTQDAHMPTEALADYCSLACDFCDEMAAKDALEAAEREKALAEREKALAEQEARQAEEKETAAAEQKAPMPEPEPQPTETGKDMTALYIVIAAAAVLGIIAVIFISKKRKMNAAWGIFAVLLFALGLFLCAGASKLGMLYSVPNGDPADTVRIFMDSLIDGDYQTAYACVDNYSGLGLENAPDSYAGELVYNALRESYSYIFDGICEKNGLSATAKVTFTYLNTKAMAFDLAVQAETVLPELIKGKKDSEIYDSDKNYLESFTDEVYLTALETVLADASSYYTTEDLTIVLKYIDGGWYIELDSGIINAVSGATAY